jgi:outer membrane protein assembly factor BamD
MLHSTRQTLTEPSVEAPTASYSLGSMMRIVTLPSIARRSPRTLLPPRLSARATLLGLLAVIAPTMAACRHTSSADIATLAAGTDRVLWESGSKALERKQYITARQYLGRLIESFPSSPHQPLARLSRADSFFREGGTENYVLAANDYREFTSVYPSHPRSDYAQLQVAECYFKQKLGPDRDQTNTLKALDEYQRFLTMFPASSLADQARERVARCRQSLARSEYSVGLFYERRQSYRAAIQRYEGLAKDYPDYADTDQVLFHLATCLVRAGRSGDALPTLARLMDGYPTSRHRAAAERLRHRAEAAAPAVTPAPSPTPKVKPR